MAAAVSNGAVASPLMNEGAGAMATAVAGPSSTGHAHASPLPATTSSVASPPKLQAQSTPNAQPVPAASPYRRVHLMRSRDEDGAIERLTVWLPENVGSIDEVLQLAQRELNLPPEKAKMLFALDGTRVVSPQQVEDDMMLVISNGEGFQENGSAPAAQTNGADMEAVTPEKPPTAESPVSKGTNGSLDRRRSSSLLYKPRRVILFLNGNASASGKMCLVPHKFTTITQLEDLATDALKLREMSRAAKALYTRDGKKLMELDMLEDEMEIVVSCGERFDPATGGAAKSTPVKSYGSPARANGSGTPGSDSKRFMGHNQRPITVYINGEWMKSRARKVVIPHNFWHLGQLLDLMTEELKLKDAGKGAKNLYFLPDGKKVKDLADVQANAVVAVTGHEKLLACTGSGKPPQHEQVVPLNLKNADGAVMRHYAINQKRVTVFINGDYQDTQGRLIVIPHHYFDMKQVLDFIQDELRLSDMLHARAVRQLFALDDGAPITEVSQIYSGMHLAVGFGEKFSPYTATGTSPRPRTDKENVNGHAANEVKRCFKVNQRKINLFINGDIEDTLGHILVVPHKFHHLQQLLDMIDEDLRLANTRHTTATALHDKATGARINNLEEIYSGQAMVVVCGGKYNPDTGTGKKEEPLAYADKFGNKAVILEGVGPQEAARHMQIVQHKVTLYVNGDPSESSGKIIVVPHKFFDVKQLVELANEVLRLNSRYKTAVEIFDIDEQIPITSMMQIKSKQRIAVCCGEKFNPLTGSGATPTKSRITTPVPTTRAEAQQAALSSPGYMATPQRKVTVVYGASGVGREPRVKTVVIPRNFVDVEQLITLVQDQLKVGDDGKCVRLLRDEAGKPITRIDSLVDGQRLTVDTRRF